MLGPLLPYQRPRATRPRPLTCTPHLPAAPSLQPRAFGASGPLLPYEHELLDPAPLGNEHNLLDLSNGSDAGAVK